MLDASGKILEELYTNLQKLPYENIGNSGMRKYYEKDYPSGYFCDDSPYNYHLFYSIIAELQNQGVVGEVLPGNIDDMISVYDSEESDGYLVVDIEKLKKVIEGNFIEEIPVNNCKTSGIINVIELTQKEVIFSNGIVIKGITNLEYEIFLKFKNSKTKDGLVDLSYDNKISPQPESLKRLITRFHEKKYGIKIIKVYKKPLRYLGLS